MSDTVTKYFEMLEAGGYITDTTDAFMIEKDPIVEAVKFELDQRSRRGVQKYGTTLYDSNEPLEEWLQHAKEEALDFACYCQKMITKLKNERYADSKA
jgi:nucleoid-associated protein YejK